MPYLGVQTKSGDNLITVKVHGPLDKFSLDPQQLRDTLDLLVLKFMDKPLSRLTKLLSDELIQSYGNGSDILWVETELRTNGGVVYGTAAEVVDIEERLPV